MKTLKKSLPAIVVIFLCFVVGRVAYGVDSSPEPAPRPKISGDPNVAGKPYHGKHKKKFSCLRELQLDDKQKSEVKKIYDSHRSQINGLWTELDQKMEVLHNAIKAGDEQNIRKSFQEVSKVRENMLILKLSILKEIKNVLSDSQKNQLEACLQERFSRFHKRWEGELMRFLNE